MDFGRATLPVAILQGVKKKTGAQGSILSLGFSQGLQVHKTAPMPSALSQNPSEASECFVPQDWFGATSGSAKALRWGRSQPQHPAVHPSVPIRVPTLTWPIQRGIHVSVCTCAPVPVPPATIGCAPTPWVCTPFIHPCAHGRGWHGCAKGCCCPRQRLGCPSPATPRAVLGQGVSRAGTSGVTLYWCDSPRGAREQR